MSDLLLRQVRPWPREPGGDAVDVLIEDGRIAAIGSDGVAPNGPDVATVDGGGGVLLPALADVHAHLDSTRLGLPFRPHTAGPGLADVLWRVVCAGEALTAAERALEWPSRSAKLVLRFALDRVAGFYRI